MRTGVKQVALIQRIKCFLKTETKHRRMRNKQTELPFKNDNLQLALINQTEKKETNKLKQCGQKENREARGLRHHGMGMSLTINTVL